MFFEGLVGYLYLFFFRVIVVVLVFYFLKRYILMFGLVLNDIEEFLLIIVNFVRCDYSIVET